MGRDVTVAVVGSRAEAELIAGMLRAHHVPARVSTDDAGGVEMALQSQGVRVLVSEANAAAATRLVGGAPPRSGDVKLNRFQRWVVRVLGGGSGEA